ncbi:MAG: alanine/glycine:cation symporter family protein [Halieaceae bacterium]|jgi:AGCS family alanine or glycine:cation symporter|nr:alanine/glycine:cation symporter family protein [Halieaceae bacterium]
MVNENTGGIDAAINAVVAPATEVLSRVVFYSVPVGEAQLPLIVLWLIVAATFFTVYFGFINLRGFGHAFRLLRGDYSDPEHRGEVSHFQALATAVSGTVGIGNIGGVAVVISLGGPGATFWLVLAGLLGMSTKMAECIAGVKYRRHHRDGTVSGGPMYYLEHSMRRRGLAVLAKPLGAFYALSIVVGCLGIGNMFQSNQAYNQVLFITGGADGIMQGRGWLFGLVIAAAVATVIVGGLRSIARVTGKLVPFMALAYVLLSLLVLWLNAERLPWAINAILTEAFSPTAISGGAVGVMILGFQRAAFSNEAGIGSAAIAHAAVRTEEPATEGFVALMEPFIDTVVVCSMTALVILTTIYHPGIAEGGVQGVELTSAAFSSTLGWSTVPLSLIAILFAFSTMIAWSYYGLKGWIYLVGNGRKRELAFNLAFCGFCALGCTVELGAVLDFSDAMVFLIAFPNIIGLYLLAPDLKAELSAYRARVAGVGAVTKAT